jgi:hypothetical protein
MEVNGIAHIFLTASNYNAPANFIVSCCRFSAEAGDRYRDDLLLRRRPDRGRHQRAVSRA